MGNRVASVQTNGTMPYGMSSDQKQVASLGYTCRALLHFSVAVPYSAQWSIAFL